MSSSHVPSFTREVADRAVSLGYQDLPDDVREIVRQCVLDWLGVTLAGSREPAALIVLEEFEERADTRDTSSPDHLAAVPVIGHPARLSIHDAALVNGTASHALDYDDVNESMLGHPTVPILPALLALAESRRSTGQELMTAFAAGYEAQCRIARALGPEHYQRGFHATATVGTFGAAMACARLLGVDADVAETALGLAATEAAGLKSMFGTMTKPLHAGLAARAGLLAARLAARGFTAAAGAIETTQGFAETHSASFDAERGEVDPPGGWYLRSNLFKYHAACFQTHSSIEGLRRLRQTESLAASDVESVTIHADAGQMRMCAIPEPATGLEVKFSLRHTAAMALAGVDTSAISSFTDAVARDAGLVALRERIAVVADRAAGGPTVVDVTASGGRMLTAAYDVSEPDKDLEVQAARLREKFTGLATPVLGVQPTAELGSLVDQLDQVSDVGALIRLCAR